MSRPYRWPYRTAPVEMEHVWGFLLTLFVNLLVFAPYVLIAYYVVDAALHAVPAGEYFAAPAGDD